MGLALDAKDEDSQDSSNEIDLSAEIKQSTLADKLFTNTSILHFYFDYSIVGEHCLLFERIFAGLERNRVLKKILTRESSVLNLATWSLTANDIEIIRRELYRAKITHLTEINLANCNLTINSELAYMLADIISQNTQLAIFNIDAAR